jgi:hypothetical protein
VRQRFSALTTRQGAERQLRAHGGESLASRLFHTLQYEAGTLDGLTKDRR